MTKVSALSVLSNAPLVWSTVRMTEVLRVLETRAARLHWRHILICSNVAAY